MSYVYIESEPSVWTVGFYNPSGAWIPESDHALAQMAAERVRWLNGGTDETNARLLAAPELLNALELWAEYHNLESYLVAINSAKSHGKLSAHVDQEFLAMAEVTMAALKKARGESC